MSAEAEAKDTDLSMWFSTYGLLTAGRILERFSIKLENDELLTAMKEPLNVYHQLLLVPLKNVFNGIILQQAHDYQVYAQKLFVDYLLSGESGKSGDSPGATTREDLEQQRLHLIEVGESFNEQEVAHQHLIAKSQASAMQVARELQKALQNAATKVGQILRKYQISKDELLILRAIRSAMVHFTQNPNETLTGDALFWVKMAEVLDTTLDKELRQELLVVLDIFRNPREKIQEIISTYLDQTQDMGIALRSYRSQFYDIILRVTEYLNLLPDYHIDLAKLEENRSSLHFDSHIGDA